MPNLRGPSLDNAKVFAQIFALKPNNPKMHWTAPATKDSLTQMSVVPKLRNPALCHLYRVPGDPRGGYGINIGARV